MYPSIVWKILTILVIFFIFCYVFVDTSGELTLNFYGRSFPKIYDIVENVVVGIRMKILPYHMGIRGPEKVHREEGIVGASVSREGEIKTKKGHVYYFSTGY